MTEPALKPCPFCGDPPKVTTVKMFIDGQYKDIPNAECEDCGIERGFLHWWNRRAGETK
jgi:hypothetical protein